MAENDNPMWKREQVHNFDLWNQNIIAEIEQREPIIFLINIHIQLRPHKIGNNKNKTEYSVPAHQGMLC